MSDHGVREFVAADAARSVQVAKLIEHQQRAMAGAGVMAPQTLIFCSLWFRLTVEAMSGTMLVYKVDPVAGQVGKNSEALRCREPLCLEAVRFGEDLMLMGLAAEDVVG